jgi:replicative DNA helicase
MRKDFLTDLKKIIENPHHEQGVLMEQVRKVLLEYDLIDQNDYTSKKISDIYKEYAANHLRSNSKKQVPTGISSYDEALGGLFPGEFVVIGASPGMGKTQLIVNMALNISKQIPVLYYSLELSELMLTSRIAAAITKIPTDRIINATITEQQKESIMNVDRKLIKKVRAMLFDLRQNGIKAAAQKHYDSIEFVSDKNCDAFLFKLKGYINFIGQVRGKEDAIYIKFNQQIVPTHQNGNNSK